MHRFFKIAPARNAALTVTAFAGLCLTPGCPGAEKPAARTKSKNAKEAASSVPAKPADSPWGDWVEKDFPFFSSVLDCRDLGEGFPKDNLTPRGIILNLGHNLWACYDTDLLRIAALWEGEEGKPPVTPEALAPGSYHVAGQKTKDGQDFLPKPIGKVWLANGIYPGWQIGDKPSFTDPREPAPSKEEVGRGPLIDNRFQFHSAGAHHGHPALRYEVDGVKVAEILEESSGVITRYFEVGAVKQPLVMVMGSAGVGIDETTPTKDNLGIRIESISGHLAMVVEPRPMGRHFCIQRSVEGVWTIVLCRPRNSSGWVETNIWPQTITTHAELDHAKGPCYALDGIPLPLENPWKRNVRLADIDFLDDAGNAVGVTMDGDVWLISGLKGDLEKVEWKRFASGLHEPMSIVVRKSQGSTGPGGKGQDAEIFVFDRNGIWKLVDTNGDQECDRYEMFCNLFAQTAETREFPNSMKLGPDGSLYISKGGQEGTTIGKHNGTVIKVAPDGKSFEVIGYGLRQPFIGVNPKTGLVTASDQQGNYVPSTPLHIIEHHHFYGHLPTIAPKEQYPETITEPLTWIPHPVNPSSVTQVWLTDAKMGPLNDEFMLVGYNRPELFRVLMNHRFERPQATVMSFWRDFDFGPRTPTSIRPTASSTWSVSRSGERRQRRSAASRASATPAASVCCSRNARRWTRACCCTSTQSSIRSSPPIPPATAPSAGTTNARPTTDRHT